MRTFMIMLGFTFLLILAGYILRNISKSMSNLLFFSAGMLLFFSVLILSGAL